MGEVKREGERRGGQGKKEMCEERREGKGREGEGRKGEERTLSVRRANWSYVVFVVRHL